jgi:hypothetical protein
MLLMSTKGYESKIIFTEEDQKDFALATCFVAGWEFLPVLDSEGNLIGTQIFYVSNADAGGNIP